MHEVTSFLHKHRPALLSLALVLVCARVFAATLYVDLNSPSPISPYTNWATAARTIQDAVDVAQYRDLVLVTNGVYIVGGKPCLGTMTNRVVITAAITVQSVNGPEQTMIQGYQVPGKTNGDGAIRCAYLSPSAVLSGFTLKNGATDSSQSAGGGIYVSGTSGSGYVTNCILAGNSAYGRGGGAYKGALFNCTLKENSASDGGGAYGSLLDNCAVVANRASQGGGASESDLVHCTVFGNSAESGGGTKNGSLDNCNVLGNWARSVGGVLGGSVYNCVVYYNHAGFAANFDGATMAYCCTAPLPASGLGNIVAEPGLASLSHLSLASACRGAGGMAYALTTDTDGEGWQNPPSIGCDEYNPGAVTGALKVDINASYTNVCAGFAVEFAGLIEGRTSASVWDFGDGVTVTNLPLLRHGWATPGDYTVSLTAYNETHPEGVLNSIVVQVHPRPVLYVSAANTNPLPPYSTRETAARDIQTAIDAADVPGALILVGDGTYNLGGRAVDGSMTNRVVVDKPVTVQSITGPLDTIIEGAFAPASTNGDGAIRCVYLGDGATLCGFTLTNGATRTTGNYEVEAKGGGVWCPSVAGVVSNCVISGNASSERGGGAYGGSYYRCIFSNNSSRSGGGAYGALLENCLLTANQGVNGGGAYGSSLANCTLTANSATYGGGTYLCSLNNSINYSNLGQDWVASSFNFSCTIPLPSAGIGNFTNAPSFVDSVGGDFHLASNSPCINAGRSGWVASPIDLDGNLRISGGTVDLGAYEYQGPASILSYVWLEAHGLPLDGSADFADPDSDGMTTWQEWVAGTDPTNTTSALRLVSTRNNNGSTTLTWSGMPGRNYFIERALEPNGESCFVRIASDIPGKSPTTSFSDNSAAAFSQVFYRVGVVQP